MTVKGNMPTPYKRLKKLPWAAVPAFSAVSMRQIPGQDGKRAAGDGVDK